MLKVEDVNYSYKHNKFSFSLHADEGEIVGILGASGSGKSTLLDLISGFIKQNSGKITFNNQDMTALFPENRPITILFQNHNLFEHLSSEKNISLGIPKPKNRDEVLDILEKVGLKGREKQIVSTLSGGQQQRVALGRALLRQKPILLLDEPFSGLDFEIKQDMLELVQKISKEQNLCTIMVTHDPKDCDKIANKVYHIKNGKIS